MASFATFGIGIGQIWLDNVACTGNESRLIDCPANPPGLHNCHHVEDAGVRCIPLVTAGKLCYSYISLCHAASINYCDLKYLLP